MHMRNRGSTTPSCTKSGWSIPADSRCRYLCGEGVAAVTLFPLRDKLVKAGVQIPES